MNNLYLELPIQHIKHLLETGEFDIDVDSPDGWVNVTDFIDKGEKPEYVLETTDHSSRIRVSGKHLFETENGWQYAEDLAGFYEETTFKVLTKTGYKLAYIFSTGRKIPVVDITVDHPNHRYYTEDVSSHNSGGGKSLFLCHATSSYLKQGKNVLYISMEMSEERIAERIDANLMNVDIDSLSEMTKEMFMNKVRKIEEKTHGKLVVKEYPTGAAHSGHFRGLLEELKTKKKFAPDVIVVDYLGICSSSRLKQGGSVNTYSYIKSISEELRALAVEYDVPLLTAMQVNRGGFGNSELELTDISESIGTIMTCDFVFSIIRTEELDALGQTLVKILKNRYGDIAANRKFVVGINRARMKLYDLEESAQSGLSNANTRTDYAPKKKPAEDKPLFDSTRTGRSMGGSHPGGFSGFKF